MLAYGFRPMRWCAFAADDRWHVLQDKSSTLCGIGWRDMGKDKPGATTATKSDWTQCALCAHHVAQEDECWGLNPDEPDDRTQAEPDTEAA